MHTGFNNSHSNHALERLRRSLGFKQSEFAAHLHISPDRYKRIVAHKQELDSAILHHVHRISGIDADTMLLGVTASFDQILIPNPYRKIMLETYSELDPATQRLIDMVLRESIRVANTHRTLTTPPTKRRRLITPSDAQINFNQKEIGERFQTARMQARFSLRNAAIIFNTGRTRLARIEHGQAPVPEKILRAVHQHWHTRPSTIVHGWNRSDTTEVYWPDEHWRQYDVLPIELRELIRTALNIAEQYDKSRTTESIE